MAELEQVLSAEIAARRGGSKRVTASIESLGDSERIAQAESKRLIEAAVKQMNISKKDAAEPPPRSPGPRRTWRNRSRSRTSSMRSGNSRS